MGSSFDRRLRELLKNAGCTFIRHGKGSHDIWHSPITDINFAVSHDIKSRHTANAILKQAGIDEKL
jgi:predicted RNA binding protein YcfA (HicA-like mRNA interferase family)